MKEKRNNEVPSENELTRYEFEAAEEQIVEKLCLSLLTHSDVAIETIRSSSFHYDQNVIAKIKL